MSKVVLICASVALFCASLAWAGPPEADVPPTYDPALFSAMKYRNIGPFRGGRVTAVAGVPSQPDTFYTGATGGGVWKTTDAGETWVNVSDTFFGSGSIGAIAVAIQRRFHLPNSLAHGRLLEKSAILFGSGFSSGDDLVCRDLGPARIRLNSDFFGFPRGHVHRRTPRTAGTRP